MLSQAKAKPPLNGASVQTPLSGDSVAFAHDFIQPTCLSALCKTDCAPAHVNTILNVSKQKISHATGAQVDLVGSAQTRQNCHPGREAAAAGTGSGSTNHSLLFL